MNEAAWLANENVDEDDEEDGLLSSVPVRALCFGSDIYGDSVASQDIHIRIGWSGQITKGVILCIDVPTYACDCSTGILVYCTYSTGRWGVLLETSSGLQYGTYSTGT